MLYRLKNLDYSMKYEALKMNKFVILIQMILQTFNFKII